ncbi:hypothetical protein HK102_003976 [Quaeritorhiza haematococci]|nr:hypothetical protein HK102_003976 [Quaeritorhiza haematococci]
MFPIVHSGLYCTDSNPGQPLQHYTLPWTPNALLGTTTLPYTSTNNNKDTHPYASRETKRVTLRQLTVFGRTLTEDKVLRSANYVRTELPVRIAHRIVDFQHLPFIVGTNPHFELMYQLYWEAFEKFRSVPPVTTLEENRMFCDLMDRMLRTHLVAIPRLAMGITETSSHLDSRQADRFINVMLRSRIGRRVLAEQHIALSAHFDDMNGDHHENPYPYFVANHRKGHGYIGIVNTRCHAGETVERCTELASQLFRDAYDMEPPTVIVDGHLDATFTYIPDHLEYILYELLKNSMQFTIEKHAPGGLPKTPVREVLPYSIAEVVVARAKEMQKDSDGEDWRLSPYPYASPPPTSSSPQQREPQKQRQKSKGRIQHDLPPIRVTIGQGNNEIMFRVSDQGGGISRDLLADMWSFSLPAKKRRLLDFDKIPKLAAKVGEAIPPSLHLGLGLPMSRAYANYWGGTIDLHSMDGYGTDAYVKIATGNQMEHITYERSE